MLLQRARCGLSDAGRQMLERPLAWDQAEAPFMGDLAG